MMTNLTLQRRQVFQSLIALSAIGGLAACGGAEETTSEQVAGQVAPGYFNASEMALIAAVAQTIIPRTDTAGAIEAGVPSVLQSLATHWGDDEYRTYWRDGLQALANALAEADGDAFVERQSDAQTTALQAYDSKVFAGEVEDGFYQDLKSTLVEAYYMSEPGATEELAYEPVPGEAIPCAPLSEFPKAWAT